MHGSAICQSLEVLRCDPRLMLMQQSPNISRENRKRIARGFDKIDLLVIPFYEITKFNSGIRERRCKLAREETVIREILREYKI